MHHFDEIFEIAAARHGGPDALEQKLGKPKTPGELAALPEDRWLATITKCVFQAGFNWKVIEAKWDGFEEAFDGFDVGRCAFMDDKKFDSLLQDTRIVRNGTKIASVRDNAAFLMELREEGGAGKVLGGWPSTDYVGLLAMLGKRGSRLGGTTAQYAMRFAGRDSFILSRDVVARLVAEGVVDKAPTSKRAMAAVQQAFNTWMQESGRSLTEISRVLAMSL
ncbi:3-methyladenine DNA glycosylase [Ruegeria marisrubri]|uniref:3-methyladenine DNA glycosylase n=1 Tax=Ruegeria marisrubri TaxID=1685379 RepID=A0A0X3TMH9_9RHOB|nr:DNA-3-methyladenine glycosylase I [Ruegeria marisrubri]KUJ76923.1 3-methyladenine DNA glycosylase [Ruegeria marisrubri]